MGSNHRHAGLEAAVLPLNYTCMANDKGVEPLLPLRQRGVLTVELITHLVLGYGNDPQFPGPQPSVLPLDEPRQFGAHGKTQTCNNLLRREALCSVELRGQLERIGNFEIPHMGWKPNALPLSYIRMAVTKGIEPLTRGFSDLRSTD